MKITLQEDFDPDTDFYYHCQFKIYHEPDLIWDRETWEDVLTTCTVYRVEADGEYAGDVMVEKRRGDVRHIVDFSIIPEYQDKGIGKAALEQVKELGKKLTAITRSETLGFFLKCGFVSKRTIRNYYGTGFDGYYIVFKGKTKL